MDQSTLLTPVNEKKPFKLELNNLSQSKPEDKVKETNKYLSTEREKLMKWMRI